MANIDIPELLKDSFAKDLNCKIFRAGKTFPFVNPDERLLLTIPSSYQEAFVSFVIALYKLYHDFGYKLPELFLGSEINHIKNISTFRTLITHGQISPKKNDRSIYVLKNFYLSSNGGGSAKWPDFFDNIYDNDWKEAVSVITDEANRVYDKLNEYAEGMQAISAFDFKKTLKTSVLGMKLYKDIYNQIIYENYSSDFTGIEAKLLASYENPDGMGITARNVVDKWITGNKDSWTYAIIEKRIHDWARPEDLLSSVKAEISASLAKVALHTPATKQPSSLSGFM